MVMLFFESLYRFLTRIPALRPTLLDDASEAQFSPLSLVEILSSFNLVDGL